MAGSVRDLARPHKNKQTRELSLCGGILPAQVEQGWLAVGSAQCPTVGQAVALLWVRKAQHPSKNSYCQDSLGQQPRPSSALRLPFSRNVSGNLGGRQAVRRMRGLGNFQPPQEEIPLGGYPLPSAIQVKTGCRGWRASPFACP